MTGTFLNNYHTLVMDMPFRSKSRQNIHIELFYCMFTTEKKKHFIHHELTFIIPFMIDSLLRFYWIFLTQLFSQPTINWFTAVVFIIVIDELNIKTTISFESFSMNISQFRYVAHCWIIVLGKQMILTS